MKYQNCKKSINNENGNQNKNGQNPLHDSLAVIYNYDKHENLVRSFRLKAIRQFEKLVFSNEYE